MYPMKNSIERFLCKASNVNLESELKLLDFKDPSSEIVGSIVIKQLITSMFDASISSQRNFILYDATLDFVWEKLNTGHWCSVEKSWRVLYTLASILKIKVLLKFTTESEKKYLTKENISDLNKDIVKICDIALIMGAPALDNFCGKLASILCQYLSLLKNDDEASVTKPKRIRIDPSTNTELGRTKNVVPLPKEYALPVEDFVNNYKCYNEPVIIKNALTHWPALSENSNQYWSVSYLQRIAGFRTVPIEVGLRYTDADWTQTLMTVNDFVYKYIDNASQNDKGYLAQHNLFDQISELKDDFDIPEYCFTGDDEPDQVAINIWFGPSDTVSPLHTDPKHNCLCQVFGKKYVRLYAEDQSEYLSAFEDGILTNTSQINLEEDDKLLLNTHPHFSKARGYECILDQGDILYIPPKCWHFVKSLSVSCSLSFWFQ